MNHTEEQHVRVTAADTEADSTPVVSAEPPSSQASDDLPAWLKPGAAAPANRAPAGRRGRPLYAWGATLAATALMVAFGLWLGSGPPAPEQKVALALPVPAGLPAPAPKAPPPLVLLAAAAPAEPAAAPLIVPATPRKVKAQGRAATAGKKQFAAKRRGTALAARTQTRPRAGARSPMSEGWNKRVATDHAGTAPRMRCKRGELARECLARYQ